MIRVFIFIFILFSFNHLEAQDKVKIYSPNPKYENLFKSIPTINDNDPLWVKLLYSESPNYFEIHDEYKILLKMQIMNKIKVCNFFLI